MIEIQYNSPTTIDVQLMPYVIQDGGIFWLEVGVFIADFSNVVHDDYDLAGARYARRLFADRYPEFVVAT